VFVAFSPQTVSTNLLENIKQERDLMSPLVNSDANRTDKV